MIIADNLTGYVRVAVSCKAMPGREVSERDKHATASLRQPAVVQELIRKTDIEDGRT